MIEEMTCKQYISEKFEEWKKTKYYENALKLKDENLKNGILESKKEKYKEEWKNYIMEYGKENALSNKVIYSYIREFSYNVLLHDFRGDRKGLRDWIPTEKYTIGY